MHIKMLVAPTVYVEAKAFEKLKEIARRFGMLYYHYQAEESDTILNNVIPVDPYTCIFALELYKIEGGPIPYVEWEAFKDTCKKEGVEIF